mmetsp:Transcript_25138/g.41385  ORF Transcript_25138/g.41385 Transcript_25138/m.41385 type:complete len:310 (+) Transcript_25138:231-1160(+)|eukprot:CAMPEP_0184657568 /NCGR_PEP_ID=MMETSP0308-20130426/20309_1 /TAXON_ID=38269 /ORGANISM="Gloeochaete witrockiana, Strain SAG 46.84" /LENGTH=309 /DNA_ID=CAMNT_0027095539 /DNA_START=162 /DNA_END=1091 /DNA_ORIENTATION=-
MWSRWRSAVVFLTTIAFASHVCALNIQSFDGIKWTLLSPGDQIMLMTHEQTTMVQQRLCMWHRENGPLPCAVGVRCDSTSEDLEVYAIGKEVQVFAKSQKDALTIPATGLSLKGVTVIQSEGSISVKCSSGMMVDVHLKQDHELSFEVDVKTVKWMYSKLRGLFGIWDDNASNDLRTREGRILALPHRDSPANPFEFPALQIIQNSWIVHDEESMFRLSISQSCPTCRADIGSYSRIQSKPHQKLAPAASFKSKGLRGNVHTIHTTEAGSVTHPCTVLGFTADQWERCQARLMENSVWTTVAQLGRSTL